jgi:hypothetical protein
MVAMDKTVGAPAGHRLGRARRTVIALAVLAAAIYVGFILMMAWR